MKPIYVTKPFLPPIEEYIEYLRNIWGSNILTNDGPYLREFERELSKLTKVKNVICLANGTLALQLSLRAFALRGKIITTPFTFVATSSTIMWRDCIPVYVDIDPDTFNIDPTRIEEKITDETVAILPVHVYGRVCEVDKIQSIAEEHNLRLIYDAAHAFGVNHNGKSVFSYGECSITSFHATKVFNTAEGGAIFTNDDELAYRIRLLRNFGYEDGKVVDVGINAKMSELCATLGLVNLKYFDDCKRLRGGISDLYYKQLKDNPNIRIPEFKSISYFPIIFNTHNYKLRILKKLYAENIYPKEYFKPSMELEFGSEINCEIAYDISNRILCLPFYHDLEHSSVVKICRIINND